MTVITNDVHRQFAEFFPDLRIRPFAYLLSERLLEGHICINPEETLNQPPYNLTELPDWSKLSTWVGTEETDIKPFILTNGKLYLHRYFRYEANVINKIKAAVVKSSSLRAEREELLLRNLDFIKSLGTSFPELTPGITGTPEAVDWQLVGAMRCLLSDFSILTGGPGTGKTTTLAKILKIFHRIYPDKIVHLTAPTGKAAMRMIESLRKSVANEPENIRKWIQEIPALTIHSLLGYKRGTVHFKHNKSNPLPYDLIVVDESSMTDMPMMSKLMDALPEHGRLILLGDQNQLASVEAGSMLGDLCRSAGTLNAFSFSDQNWFNRFITDESRCIPGQPVPVPNAGLLSGFITELKYSHRFNALGLIGNVAKAVLHNDADTLGELTDLYQKTRDQDKKSPQLLFDVEYDEELLKQFASGYEAFIKEDDKSEALKKLNSIRILTAVREGKFGLYELNKRIEQYLQSKKLINTGTVWYKHRPVLITRNNSELGLVNGDVGIVREDAEGTLRVWFDSGILDEHGKPVLRSVLPAYLSHTETTYAMTIHKSQGSEFDSVMIFLPKEPGHRLLTRELLYTAITRAKQSVIISGTKDQIIACVGRQVTRASGVSEKLSRPSIPN
ncbi:MAG: exodeoxyribonuclease V subunit alpha [Cyclobacteriaceae bacterium]